MLVGLIPFVKRATESSYETLGIYVYNHWVIMRG